MSNMRSNILGSLFNGDNSEPCNAVLSDFWNALKNCWSCPQKFYECIGAGGHELYKRATVNVNKSNRGDPTFENASQIVVNIFWVHWCRRTWVIRAGPILGSFLARNSCYILQRTNNINIDPRVTITPHFPISKKTNKKKMTNRKTMPKTMTNIGPDWLLHFSGTTI